MITVITSFHPAVTNTFFFVGYFLGGAIFGMVADARGRCDPPITYLSRKPSVFLAVLFCAAGTALGPLLAQIFPPPSPWVYAATRILPGAGSIGAYLMAFTLSVELVGSREQFPGIPWNVTVFSIVG